MTPDNQTVPGCKNQRNVTTRWAILPSLAAFFATLVIGLAVSEARQQSTPFDPSELMPGGAATSKASTTTANAFSASSGNLSFEKEFDFKIGNALFRKFWVSAPASTRTSDGLGPLYNARSCQGCHLKDGRGHPPEADDEKAEAVSLLLRLSIPPQDETQKKQLSSHRVNTIPDPVYGSQLQPFAIAGQRREGTFHITYTEVPFVFSDGTRISLRQPTYVVRNLAFGPLHPDVMMSGRIAPQMIGLGLLEAIPEADILSRADPDDHDGDGISGRPNRVWSVARNSVSLGRFGWKAGVPTLKQQTADALVHDIGISSALFPLPAGDCTAAQLDCMTAPNGAPKSSPNIEISDNLSDLINFYAANLAVPPRRNANLDTVKLGRALFYAAGCAQCHTPGHQTGNVEGQPHLSNQRIWPYTDLLLHDMGEGLADNRPEGVANGREWRTPPLWGIGLTEIVSGHTYFLHDGRARNLTEAIAWHGGEATSAREAFRSMTSHERADLIAFLNSL